jgi:DHA1 family inner membrane transport protein
VTLTEPTPVVRDVPTTPMDAPTDTTPTDTTPDTTATAGSPRRRNLALFALALGGFGVGANEFVSMGLLPGIAHSLLPGLMASDPDVGIATAGHAISAYAIGVAVGAPILAVLATKFSRTKLIVVLAAILAVGALASASMPTFDLTVGARFFAGLPHGAYFGVASLIAGWLMGPGNQGKGIALAMSGLSVANLAGVPVFTAVGQMFGWRIVYVLVAVVFVIAIALLAYALPRQEKPRGVRLTDELRALRRVQLWAVLAIIAVGFAGSFAVFSYIADITEQVAGASSSFVPLVLAAAGAGMLVGNIVGGFAVDKSLFTTVIAGFALYIVAIAAFNVTSSSAIGLIATFAVMNAAQQILGPAMQSWLMRISGRSEVLGASIHHAAFNLANALGALAGGTVIAAGWGMRAPAVLGLVLATAGMVMTLVVLGLLRARASRRRLLFAVTPLETVERTDADLS